MSKQEDEVLEGDFEEKLRSLDDNEPVELGDIIKDIGAGCYYEVTQGSIHQLMVGVRAKNARLWSGVSEIFRKK